jgi:hypothetical protein
MRLTRSKVVMAVTAVMVVVWAGVASGTNGDAIKAGQTTTATAQTNLSSTQSSGIALLVTVGGTTAAAALKGQNNASGAGISGSATGPNAFGNASSNTAASHGTGAAGLFAGNHNDGVRGTTTNPSSAGVKGVNTGSGTGVSGTSGTGAGMFAKTGGSAPALQATNTSTGPAAAFQVGAGVTPFTVSSSTKVANLNADKLDGLDSTDFLSNTVPLSLTGSTASDGVISGTNTGSANGVQGVTSAVGASGVYGQNNGAGFGLAGRANAPGGVGVYAESLGGGPALQIHTEGAPPMSVDSSAKVANLNADMVDGATILSNRIISTTQNDHIIQLPGFGDFNVVSCDHTNAVFQWSSGGPAAFVFWWDLLNSTDSFEGVANLVTSNPRPHHFVTVQLARDKGSNTSMATVTLTTHAAGCVFAAQAVVQPG